MTAFRTTAIASAAAVALFAAGSLAASTDAYAGKKGNQKFWNGFAVGALTGIVASQATNPYYPSSGPVYYSGQTCTLQQQQVYKVGYAYPVVETVQVCY